MSHPQLKIILTLILGIGLFIFSNKYFLDNKISYNFTFKPAQSTSSFIFDRLAKIKKTLLSINTVSNLINKNLELEKKNIELLSQLAQLDNLKSENDFLKKTLEIFGEIHYQFKDASIYAWDFGPSGYNVLLNKGGDSGISEGDIVITKDKILIGSISEVGSNFSKVLVVTDPRFRVTARVLNTSTAGIASGALLGMNFDLIIYDDKIEEGDIVVSSGNDTFPASLMIGEVSKVNLAEDQLFKKVDIRPYARDIILGRVLVLRPTSQK